MLGLMQEVPLTIDLMLRRAATVGRDVEVVSVEPGGVRRATWGVVAERALRLGAALDALGVAPGARVGTFAWNGQRHLELYLGVPGSGRVLHTVNLRLFADDIAYVVEHAGDELLFVDASLTGRWGPAVPGVELRLRAPDGGLAPWDGAATGELEARGAWVASAYHAPDDDANATRFSADGWFRTGDVARIGRDGAVEIVDREKDLVKSGGEWISSAELERAIVEHPAVREVVVIAVPDEEWGERPAALVVPEPAGAAPSAEELRAWLARRVARWWIPAVWETVGELPKTGVGKYDKRALRARYAAGPSPAASSPEPSA